MGVLREVWNDAGDPGRHRRKHRGFLRRFKPSKLLRRLTPLARFIPGVGTVMDTVERARDLLPAGDGGFVYADEEGDPFDFDEMGDPGRGRHRGPAKTSHHKASGGHKRSRHKKRGGGGPGLGEQAGQFFGGLAGAGLQQVGPLGTFLGQQTGIIPKEEGLPMLPGVEGGSALAAVGGGMVPAGGKHGRAAKPLRMVHRHLDAWTAKGTRTMNASNPRALRHALRRVEGFERIVKRMERAYPRLKRVTHGHAHAPVHHKKGR